MYQNVCKMLIYISGMHIPKAPEADFSRKLEKTEKNLDFCTRQTVCELLRYLFMNSLIS